MALITCKECGREISRSVKKCPNCGAKTQKAKIAQLIGIIAFCIIAILFYNLFKDIGNSHSKQQAQARARQEAVPAIEVTLNELFTAYKENEVAADSKFKNKKIKITGRISDFGTILGFGNPTISFSHGFDSLQMTFDKSDSDRIGQLKKGDTITVEGKCTGTFAGDISMNDCKIIN